MTTRGQIMRMRAVTEGLPVAAGQIQTVQPGGELHLMLIGLKRPLRTGEHVPISLTFARAALRSNNEIGFDPAGAAPAMQIGPHDHMDHPTHMGGR